jgi:hypothetical protein
MLGKGRNSFIIGNPKSAINKVLLFMSTFQDIDVTKKGQPGHAIN